MSIWYKTSYGANIEEVEVLRETEHCLFIRGYRRKEQRVHKVGSYDRYFPTEELAIAHVQDVAAQELENAQRMLARTQEKWDAVKDAATVPVKRLQA